MSEPLNKPAPKKNIQELLEESERRDAALRSEREERLGVAKARALEIIPHHDDIMAIAMYTKSMKLDWALTGYPAKKGWTKFRVALFLSFVASMLSRPRVSVATTHKPRRPYASSDVMPSVDKAIADAIKAANPIRPDSITTDEE